ncbi:hypothetical protein BJX61DRAFT_546580 [Aspergillus egyptiacus]|nr:hypothetical protein BJX61DRAFT_546580 [Aspergillus egyptiacus]
MPCTTRSTLCPSCRSYSKKLSGTDLAEYRHWDGSSCPLIFHRALDRIIDFNLGLDIQRRVERVLRKKYGARVPVHVHIQGYPRKSERRNGTSMDVSVMIDFPEKPRVGNWIMDALYGEYPHQPENPWSVEMPGEGEDVSLFRLRWFVE